MKGIILAGGTGSRLYPLTKVTNKHLLPVYNKPMIYYPLFSLKEAGVDEVLVISGKGHCGNFLELLNSGAEMGMKFTYEIQAEAKGIADALSLAKDFIKNEKFIVVLGDNIFEDNLSESIKNFRDQKEGARILLKEVANPSSYGVCEIENKKITSIVEKPKEPKSNLAVTGFYMYDSTVFEIIKGLSPSARNELEITDVNNFYLKSGNLEYDVLNGFWGDCGESFDSLLDCATLIKNSRLSKMDEKLEIA